jgi:hypothetical protein
MKPSRILLALALTALMAGAAYVAQQVEPPGVKMVAAAAKFLDSLSAEQKAKAVFAFDDKERTRWHFVPLEKGGKPTRKGLPLEEMKDEQKKAALALVAAGTSARGHQAAVTIMSLEAILKEAEKGRGPTRDPEWYFFTVFGTPSKTGRWGWRVEGHHLSLNFTLDGGKVAATTPAFFGANPATVKNGPKKGLRTLAPAEDLAFALFKALSDDQKQVAHQEKPFPEPQAQTAQAKVGDPVGLPAAKMTDAQKGLLQKLIQSYADRMPAEVAEVQLRQVKEAGLDKVHFAFSGGAEPGQKHTYRVQGPTFVIEFKNDQADGYGNPANHIHSVWRNLKGDFGSGGL